MIHSRLIKYRIWVFKSLQVKQSVQHTPLVLHSVRLLHILGYLSLELRWHKLSVRVSGLHEKNRCSRHENMQQSACGIFMYTSTVLRPCSFSLLLGAFMEFQPLPVWKTAPWRSHWIKNCYSRSVRFSTSDLSKFATKEGGSIYHLTSSKKKVINHVCV